MNKIILFVILESYSDREYLLLADALQLGLEDKTSQYDVKTVSVTKTPIKSIGGFTTVLDYSVDDLPTMRE